jgi:hypothetical protein
MEKVKPVFSFLGLFVSVTLGWMLWGYFTESTDWRLPGIIACGCVGLWIGWFITKKIFQIIFILLGICGLVFWFFVR